MESVSDNISRNAPVQNLVQQVIRQAANVPAAVEEEKPEFYEDPAGLDLDSLDPDNPLNRDLIVENPIRKRGKNKKKKKSSKSNAPGNALGAAGQDMGPAAGLNFSVQKLPARKRASWFRRFLTATAYYAGKSIGKTLNFIGNLFYVPLSGNLGKLWRGRSGNKENAKVTQEKRDHDTIPGWNGAKYEKGPGKNNEVLADFRRVPTVWSYLTAKQAEDEKGDPLPPKVGIYINQPKEGEDKDINWLEFGHSGIGVEYSRYSRVSKRYERYMLRYGFYMAGASVSAGIMGDAKGAITPGMLRDESNSMYTISRTFKATAKQVNDILNASETWADKGYNASTRNCTTFVKEMVRDVAHLPLGSDIFTEDRVRLSSLANFGHFGEVSSTANAKIGMETDFEKLGQMDDMTYAGFGNKRTNKEEYRRYKDSIEEGRRVKYADTPNSAVENMRRLEGPYAGELGSLQYTGSMPRNRNKKLERTYQTVSHALDDAGKDAANKILQVTGKTDSRSTQCLCRTRNSWNCSTC